MSTWRTLPLDQAPFTPLQNPTNPLPSPDGLSLTLNTGHGSNYWRTPFPAPGRAPTTGGMWGFRRKIGKEGFEVRCEVEVAGTSDQQSSSSSDQAALLVQLSPTEWVKTGAEFVNGKMWHGAVVCNPFSDWSIQPPSTNCRFTISYDPALTTLRIYLGPSSPSAPSSSGTTSSDPLASSTSIPSAEEEDMMIREVKTFGLASAGLTHLIPGRVPPNVDPAAILVDMEVMIGLMACSPLGEGEGPECYFRRFEMREGVRGVH